MRFRGETAGAERRRHVQLDFQIQAQPTRETCGPTCLQAVYRYYGDFLPLEQVVAEVPMLKDGGTLSVMLACHALRRGYGATIHSYNLQLFDPTWARLSRRTLRGKLTAQARHKKDPKLRAATAAYLEFLDRGGQLEFEDLSRRLIRSYLSRGLPILTGLSATYLYRCARECTHPSASDPIRGTPAGHFVVLSGYNKVARTVQVADPLRPNPVSRHHLYAVGMDRVIGAILLGIVTYDANFLVIEPK